MNKRFSWSKELSERIVDMYLNQNLSTNDISLILNIPESKIKTKLYSLKVYKTGFVRFKWNDCDLNFVKANCETLTVNEMSEILGIPSNVIRNKIYSLGKKCKRKSLFSEDGTKKRCSMCKEFLPLDNFNKRKDGYRVACRICEYNHYIDNKLAKECILPETKPPLEFFLKRSNSDKKFCIKCNTELTNENYIVRYSNKRKRWDISSLCRKCQSEARKKDRFKLIEKRGY